ncbi:hypothetical protein HBH53_081140 [Parastagonospora nodorum]|nr:hypothetical protein HBH53_081140 [Parastagonospora nodorum]KAH3985082.1 hypothetical protein HBH52_052290 [Parastagonospora nodorum]KAH4108886.1 hypothetical protein HBH46_037690 [Parastagonospora nodorum]KAH4858476.1 hypothetical protein HBH75_053240 [Parastagonospora nodorum]KAH5056913.1 hypothetical protein HBH96_115130 [Parastagonospora nodorum]
MRFSGIQRISSWDTVTLLAGIISSVAAAQLQYCRVDDSLRTDQCLAISTFHNSTTNANDFYLLVSAKFEDRKGYAAFGTGSTMDGSLMFVLYPGAQDKDVTLSIRTTKFISYHYPPQPPPEKTPDHQTIKTWVEGVYYNAQIVCYGCDTWHRNSANVTSKKQKWIFANHYEYVMQTNDIKKPMSLHTDYDVFELDMTMGHNVDGSPVAPELVDNGRKSIGAGTDSSWKPSQLFAIHGLLLASAFVVLMPLGVAGIRTGRPNAFKIHWVIQLSAVAFAVSGTAWGIYLTWGHPITIATSNGAHKILGLTLLVSVVLTPMLGYLHHVRYLKFGRATGVTVWHRRFGASTLASAWVNVLLGLWIAGQPVWYFLVAIGVMACSALAIYFAPTWGTRFTKASSTKEGYSTVDGEEGSEQGLLQKEDRT